jgi:hypothetical protein
LPSSISPTAWKKRHGWEDYKLWLNTLKEGHKRRVQQRRRQATKRRQQRQQAAKNPPRVYRPSFNMPIKQYQTEKKQRSAARRAKLDQVLGRISPMRLFARRPASAKPKKQIQQPFTPFTQINPLYRSPQPRPSPTKPTLWRARWSPLRGRKPQKQRQQQQRQQGQQQRQRQRGPQQQQRQRQQQRQQPGMRPGEWLNPYPYDQSPLTWDNAQSTLLPQRPRKDPVYQLNRGRRQQPVYFQPLHMINQDE